VLARYIPGLADMRSGGYVGGPAEFGMMQTAAAQMAHFYRLPIYCSGGMTDSKLPDAQAGYEKMATLLLAAIGGCNYLHHAVGMAAGVVAVEGYQEEGLIENAQQTGLLLNEGLKELRQKHLSVGDVRSIGLFPTIELVKDRETKGPLARLPGLPSSAPDQRAAARLSAASRERDMHCCVKWNHLFPIPRLCISEVELRDGLQILDEVLELADAMVPGG
jgi:4-aminobutyrate aminotransferase-like enzyme